MNTHIRNNLFLPVELSFPCWFRDLHPLRIGEVSHSKQAGGPQSERVLNLIEKSGPQPVAEDPGDWTLLGGGKSSLGELERTDADSILLEVRDDGVGFNVGAVDANYEQRGSLGMVNMRERSELVNGILRIESAEGKGTRIILELPVAGTS